jgi:ABC-type sugar transport system substrate-binding protein
MITSRRFRLASLAFFSATLITSGFAQDKKLNSVCMSVGDLGNPFFVQIAHGAENKSEKFKEALGPAHEFWSNGQSEKIKENDPLTKRVTASTPEMEFVTTRYAAVPAITATTPQGVQP